MDEMWERAMETALDGQTDVASVKTLTLDGAVKCLQGRLPPPSLFEKFQNLQHLSIANIGVSSLEQFPRLQSLEKLILSDNRISGGLEFLVEAGLNSLRDLDLSNNRIQDINDLRPLAELRLVSLDLYECPVTRVKDYRSRVFGLIKSLKYLDKMDAEENERPESDDEEEDEEEEEEDDPGSGEIDGEERAFVMNNGHRGDNEGIVDVDEDEESDADEEETETSRRRANGSSSGVSHSNGFRIEGVDIEEDEEDEEGEGEGEGEDEEEIDDEGDDDDDDEDVVEVHEIEDSDDEEDGVEDDEEEDDDDDDEEEVNNENGEIGGQQSTGRLTGTEGEIDGHEQGEDDGDDVDDIGETEEEQGVEVEGDFEDDEEAEDEEDDHDTGYLVQPVGQVAGGLTGSSDMDPGNDDEDADLVEEIDEEDDEDGEVQELPPSSSHKRKRDGDKDNDKDNDDGGDEAEEEKDDDSVEYTKSTKSSKHH